MAPRMWEQIAMDVEGLHEKFDFLREFLEGVAGKVDGLIKAMAEEKGIIMALDDDAKAAVAALQPFLADLANVLPDVQAALANAAGGSDPDTSAALGNIVSQLAPLQAQFDALVPAAPAPDAPSS